MLWNKRLMDPLLTCHFKWSFTSCQSSVDFRSGDYVGYWTKLISTRVPGAIQRWWVLCAMADCTAGRSIHLLWTQWATLWVSCGFQVNAQLALRCLIRAQKSLSTLLHSNHEPVNKASVDSCLFLFLSTYVATKIVLNCPGMAVACPQWPRFHSYLFNASTAHHFYLDFLISSCLAKHLWPCSSVSPTDLLLMASMHRSEWKNTIFTAVSEMLQPPRLTPTVAQRRSDSVPPILIWSQNVTEPLCALLSCSHLLWWISLRCKR